MSGGVRIGLEWIETNIGVKAEVVDCARVLAAWLVRTLASDVRRR